MPRFLLIAALLHVGSEGAIAGAKRPEPGHESPRAAAARSCSRGLGGIERRLGSLDLDEQRRAAIELRLRDARQDAEEIRGRLERARMELAGLLATKQPSETSAFKKVDEIGRLETELQKVRLAASLRVRDELAPEQRTVFDTRRSRGCARP